MLLICRGCGTEVDALGPSPWACPNRTSGDVDHVLVLGVSDGEPDGAATQPFIRYRRRLGSYTAATASGWSDGQFVEGVASLDDAVARVWGSGFTTTPTTIQPALAAAVGIDQLWVKDETGNVSGSHKARHLFGLALWLQVRSSVSGARADRLAIASCGNAAIGAAVVASALGQPLDVFVPVWADESVVASLDDLGASIIRCERRPGEHGDPCVLRMREAVSGGATPFGCQGPDNALTIDGGRTIGWELAEQVPELSTVYVQMGGGALATSLTSGLAEGGSTTRVVAVQSAGCAPFDRAWHRVEQVGLAAAVHHRSSAMWPWEAEPHSAATGILDDETYDWAGVVDGVTRSGGDSLVAPETAIVRAHELAHLHTAVDADATGTAGLAGLLADVDRVGAEGHVGTEGGIGIADGPIAVLFTGVTR